MAGKTAEFDILAKPVAFAALDTTASGTGGDMAFNIVTLDTNSAFSGGLYTVPVAGYYSVNAEAWVNGNAAPTVSILKNGSFLRSSILSRVANDSISGGIVAVIVQCNVGDTISVRVTGGFTLSNVSNNYLNIERVGAVGF